MSYRKTRLIQERNLLLERKYILEQAPPTPMGATPPPPQTPITPPPAGGTPALNQTKKITEKDIKEAIHCSDKREKIVDNPKYERKEEKINGVNYVYYLTEKKDMVFCRDKPDNKSV